MDQSLRGFLRELESIGNLRRIAEPVSRRYELSALMAAGDDGPALLFERVDGSNMPVVGGVLGTRARIAAGLGVDVDGIQARILNALAAPIAAREIADAPSQQIIVETPPNSRSCRSRGPLSMRLRRGRMSLPGDRRPGPGAWCGEPLDRPPEAAWRGAGDGGDRPTIIWPCWRAARSSSARACRSPSRSAITRRSCWPRACTWTSVADELHHAGGLLGEPLEVVRTAVGLAVPAHCELVLAGRDASELVPEGLVSEFHDMYEDYASARS